MNAIQRLLDGVLFWLNDNPIRRFDFNFEICWSKMVSLNYLLFFISLKTKSVKRGFMKIFGSILGKVAFLFVISMMITASKCPSCDLTNNKFDSARVAVITIGTPRRYLEIKVSGFHPNAKATLSIPEFPTQNGGSENLSVPVTFDNQGKLEWIKEPILLLINNGDPKSDISISIAEDGGGCFAATSIKRGEFMKIN